MSQLYEYIWRNKWLTSNSKNMEEMQMQLRAAANRLEEMMNAGVWLDVEGGKMTDDYAVLITDNPLVAEKYNFDLIEDDDDEF